MNLKFKPLKALLLAVIIASCFVSNAQHSCDTTLLNAHILPAGYKRLYVPSEPCSIYYYSTTAMYGIDARRQSVNLGIPQLIINSYFEDTAVSAALYAQGAYNISADVWLGITDSAQNSGNSPYHWRTFAGDTNITYFNWTSGEPNNLSPQCKINGLGSCFLCTGADSYWCTYGEDCAVMNASGQWLDITCEGNNVKHVCVLEVNACQTLTKPADATICAGSSVTLSTKDTGGIAPYTYTWNPGSQTGQTITITPAATETLTVEGSDKYGCITDSTFVITVNQNVPVANAAGPDQQLCPGAVDTLGTTPNPNYTYVWTPSLGLSNTTIANPTVSFASNPSGNATDTTYILTATWGNCSRKDTVHITLNPNVNNNFTLSSLLLCGSSEDLTVNYSGTPTGTATYNWSFDSANVISGNGPGAYVINWPTSGPKTITLSVNQNGCTAAPVSATVIVSPKPVAVITPSGTTLASSVAAHYEWLFNGQPISGGTGQSITATASGYYQVILTDSAGCSDTSSKYVIKGLGINNVSNQDGVLIYPNPSNGKFIVETADAIGGELTITDLLGRIILKQTVTANIQPIEISRQQVSAGEYFVTVKTETRQYTGKTIIARE